MTRAVSASCSKGVTRGLRKMTFRFTRVGSRAASSVTNGVMSYEVAAAVPAATTLRRHKLTSAREEGL